MVCEVTDCMGSWVVCGVSADFTEDKEGPECSMLRLPASAIFDSGDLEITYKRLREEQRHYF